MQKISTLIADSQYLVRQGIRSILSSDPRFDIVAEAANSEELKHKLRSFEPQLAILDYHCEHLFHIDDVQDIKSNYPDTQVLIISSDDRKRQIYQVLEYGACGFLTKECDKEEIINAALATSRGEKFFCNKVLDFILDDRVFQKEVNCSPTRLTSRETQIIQLIASGCSTKKIADILHLSVHTIYTHRKNIMRKLEINSASEMVAFAYNEGIIE